MDLKKVAAEVVDGWTDEKKRETLREHDLHYHDGNYRGGKCLFRERLDREDCDADDLEDARHKEEIIHSERRKYADPLANAFFAEFSNADSRIGQRYGSRTRYLEPDSEGIGVFEVQCKHSPNPGDPDPSGTLKRRLKSQFSAARLRDFFKEHGYKLESAQWSATNKSGKTDGTGAKVPEGYVMRFGITRPENFTFATERDNDVVTRIGGGGGGELDDAAKSQALKRFGFKSEGGQAVRRTPQDDLEDAMRRRSGISGR